MKGKMKGKRKRKKDGKQAAAVSVVVNLPMAQMEAALREEALRGCILRLIGEQMRRAVPGNF